MHHTWKCFLNNATLKYFITRKLDTEDIILQQPATSDGRRLYMKAHHFLDTEVEREGD